MATSDCLACGHTSALHNTRGCRLNGCHCNALALRDERVPAVPETAAAPKPGNDIRRVGFAIVLAVAVAFFILAVLVTGACS